MKSLFEWVSLGAKEEVYSAAFAWILSDDSPLPRQERLSIIAELSGINTTGCKAVSAKTEWNNIDLLLTAEPAQAEGQSLYVAIENKIKATDGKAQLDDYDRTLEHELSGRGAIAKIFLTLTGEEPRSGKGWRAVCYSTLLEAIRRAEASANNPSIVDLCAAMGRLVELSNAARESEAMLVSAAFRKSIRDDENSGVRYMREMRLEQVVQRIWLGKLASAIGVGDPWMVSIGETRGNGLLDVKVRLNARPHVAIGLQVQGSALKMFCAPEPYPEEASPEEDEAVQKILSEMWTALDRSEAFLPSRSRRRGFRSCKIAEMPSGRDVNSWAEVVMANVEKLTVWLSSGRFACVTKVIASRVDSSTARATIAGLASEKPQCESLTRRYGR